MAMIFKCAFWAVVGLFICGTIALLGITLAIAILAGIDIILSIVVS